MRRPRPYFIGSYGAWNALRLFGYLTIVELISYRRELQAKKIEFSDSLVGPSLSGFVYLFLQLTSLPHDEPTNESENPCIHGLNLSIYCLAPTIAFSATLYYGIKSLDAGMLSEDDKRGAIINEHQWPLMGFSTTHIHGHNLLQTNCRKKLSRTKGRKRC